MATADEIIDRRRLRRKITFWRAASFLVLALALVSVVMIGAREAIFSGTTNDHVARVDVTGIITNDEPMLKLLASLKKKKKVKAVILNISSPGGSTVGGEAMFEAVRDIASEKPVAATVGTLAASAGYMVASASDHIVARRSSIVGSIGVIFQYTDASELLDKIGVKVNSVKSSPLKAEPSPFSPASEEAVAMIDRLIKDSYNWFVDLVAERRQMDRGTVIALADGSIFTGSQSMDNGLVDAIGGEQKAIDWLNSEKGIDKELKVVEYKPKRPGSGLFDNPAAIDLLARYLGFDTSRLDMMELENLITERIFPSGLVSIWQSGD